MKRRHSHFFLFLLTVIVTAIVYGLFAYMRHSIAVSLAQTLSAEENAKRNELYRQQGQSLATLYNATTLDRARLSSLFVSDDKTIQFIEILESLGARAGSSVSLSSIDADDLGSGGPGATGFIRTHIDLHGSWQSVMRTIMLAETLPYDVSVSHVRLDTSGTPDAKGASPEWRASFVVAARMIHQVQ